MTFLTPLAALFVLAAAVPLTALLLTERRAGGIRRVLRLAAPRRRTLLPVALALVLLPALVAVAAAQPVVIRQQRVQQRADAQAFFVFDTSLSMQAADGPGKPTRLDRAKQLALRLEHSLADVPAGIASMTDRSLPVVMPTTDRTLFARAVEQSIAVDRPPPSQPHQRRATTFEAIVPLMQSNFFSQGVQRRLLVVLTDGESATVSPLLKVQLQRRVTSIFVHVWAPGERIWHGQRADPNYTSDPLSIDALGQLAQDAGGSMYDEHELGRIERSAHDAIGQAQAHSLVSGYARVALAPWIILAGVVPLGFLLWRRNA
jgi:Mg-chelatase subunit ChlD